MAEIIMPKMGDAMEEGRIVQWLKSIGDSVKAGEAVAEIETDKSNVEIEADDDGVLQSIVFPEGEVAPVGAVIAVVGAPGASVAPAAQKTQKTTAAAAAPPAEQDKEGAKEAEMRTEEQPAAAAAPSTSSASSVSRTNGSGPSPSAPKKAPSAEIPAAAATAAPRPVFRPYDSFIGALPENLGGSASLVGEPLINESGEIAAGGATDRVRATPVARAMAEAHGVNLSSVAGSGSDGGVTKADIEAAIAKAPARAGSALAPETAGTDEVQEYNAMRRTIAKRLAESKSTIPHFYVTAEMDVENLLLLRQQINAGAGEDQPKITMNDCLIKTVAVALGEHPLLNAVFSDNTRIIRNSINIGVAVSIADGLIVPVVKNCQAKSLRAIARETRPLIEKTLAGKLAPADYTGGTFTISNLGSLPDVKNIEHFSAIINPGEGAILAVSSAQTVPAVVNDQIVPRKRMKVTLSADHRIVDGADGARFVETLKRIIENPLQMLV